MAGVTSRGVLSAVKSQCYHKNPSKFRQFLQLHFEARSMAVDLSQDLAGPRKLLLAQFEPQEPELFVLGSAHHLKIRHQSTQDVFLTGYMALLGMFRVASNDK